MLSLVRALYSAATACCASLSVHSTLCMHAWHFTWLPSDYYCPFLVFLVQQMMLSHIHLSGCLHMLLHASTGFVEGGRHRGWLQQVSVDVSCTLSRSYLSRLLEQARSAQPVMQTMFCSHFTDWHRRNCCAMPPQRWYRLHTH